MEETLDVGGQKLVLEHFPPVGKPVGALVALHGYAAHCGLYRHVGTALAAQGWAVTWFDCRGHGRSAGPRGHVRRFAEYLDDLDGVVRRARERTPEGPLALLGHSHGGTIVADFVLQGRAAGALGLDRVVLATPYLDLAMSVPAYKRALAPVMTRVWPSFAMHNGIRGENVSRTPMVVDGFDTDPLVHHVATSRWWTELLAAQARIAARASEWRLPTLLLVAGQDRIVSTAASLAFAAATGPVVEVRRYEALFHEVFLEPEREQVIADIGAWLRKPARTENQAPHVVPGIL